MDDVLSGMSSSEEGFSGPESKLSRRFKSNYKSKVKGKKSKGKSIKSTGHVVEKKEPLFAGSLTAIS